MKKVKVEVNHHGHRQRLLDTIMKAGIDKVSDVVALEFILTYVIPRVDTNEISHALLTRFGGVAQVLNTDWERLAETPGMGETSAKKLSLFADIFDYYTEKLLANKCSFDYRTDIADYFEQLLRFRNVETSYIVGVDASFRVQSFVRLESGGVFSVGVGPEEVAKFAISNHPAFIFIAHNHPQGSAKPSQGDEDGTAVIASLLESLNIKLLDHIIVGVDGIYGVVTKDFYRIFENHELPSLT